MTEKNPIHRQKNLVKNVNNDKKFKELLHLIDINLY